MDSTLFRLVLPALLAGSLLASTAAQGEGEMVIGREVPARPAIRHGDPSPEVSRVSTSPSSTMPTVTQQLADPVLAATHAVTSTPALHLPVVAQDGPSAWSGMAVGAVGGRQPAGGAGAALSGVGMGHLLQSALHP
ncbi:hypothetical protein [Aquitalea aquatica]|uniref:Uncharacterized protein n=1 Tax=Aquitalea aquatica TaxID=3044273 RepID=A0A838YH50_9NEIS|nr:hypothetical protein [Aquitalea magnusonii]MBA4710375.1 hypothetical protein [Aquitalea magnusonii]